eukprot:s5064_g3.t1
MAVTPFVLGCLGFLLGCFCAQGRPPHRPVRASDDRPHGDHDGWWEPTPEPEIDGPNAWRGDLGGGQWSPNYEWQQWDGSSPSRNAASWDGSAWAGDWDGEWWHDARQPAWGGREAFQDSPGAPLVKAGNAVIHLDPMAGGDVVLLFYLPTAGLKASTVTHVGSSDQEMMQRRDSIVVEAAKCGWKGAELVQELCGMDHSGRRPIGVLCGMGLTALEKLMAAIVQCLRSSFVLPTVLPYIKSALWTLVGS